MRLANQDHESAKDRALRVPLDYVRTVDKVHRLKLAISVAAGLAAAGFGAWVILSAQGDSAFSHGPVAQAHAVWDAECSACHLDFVAIRDDAANPLARLSGQGSQSGNSKLRQVDQKCQTCHAGPRHHDNEREADVATCASCHTDHRGRTADIARPANAACTFCHENIAAHRSSEVPSKASPSIENVVAFQSPGETGGAATHPEFRSLSADPGNIKFRHSIHMTPGIRAPDPKGDGKTLLTLADLPAEFVEQYRHSNQPRGEQEDRAYPVQLECASCHQSNASPTPAAGEARIPTSGAYMLPVRYENHCRACHHLKYEPTAGKELKHGLSSEESRAFLLGQYSYAARSGQLSAESTRLIPRRPIPGRSPTDFSTSEVADLDAKVANAERYLHDTQACAKCHEIKPDTNASSDSRLPDVQPANIPQVWLQHARFDHAAHRALSCAECHALAFAEQDSSEGPKDQDVVMISGRDECLKCHSPKPAGGSSAGARFDCVECHRYHGADLAPPGAPHGAPHGAPPGAPPGAPHGAAHRGDSNSGLTIDEFLQGTGNSPQKPK